MGLDLGLDVVPGLLGGGGGVTAAEYTTLLAGRGFAEIWPLSDMTDATILASQSAARNGTATGWDLTAPNAVIGPLSGDPGLTPYSDGANDYGNIVSASLASIFNGTIGGVLVWSKAPAAVWASATNRDVLTISAGALGTNLILIRLNSSGVTYFYRAATLTTSHTEAYSGTGWTLATIGYNDAANLVQFTLNGVQVGGDLNTPGTWSGGILTALIGALNTTPTGSALGNMALVAVKFGSMLTVADALAAYAGVS